MQRHRSERVADARGQVPSLPRASAFPAFGLQRAGLSALALTALVLATLAAGGSRAQRLDPPRAAPVRAEGALAPRVTPLPPPPPASAAIPAPAPMPTSVWRVEPVEAPLAEEPAPVVVPLLPPSAAPLPRDGPSRRKAHRGARPGEEAVRRASRAIVAEAAAMLPNSRTEPYWRQ